MRCRRRCRPGQAHRRARARAGATRRSPPSRAAATSRRPQPVGQQQLVGGGAQVALQLAGREALEDPAQQLLDLGDHAQRRGPRRRAGSGRRSSACARSSGRARRVTRACSRSCGLARERRHPGAEPELGAAAALEQAAQRQQVVAQRLDQRGALGAEVKAGDRPGQRGQAGAALGQGFARRPRGRRPRARSACSRRGGGGRRRCRSAPSRSARRAQPCCGEADGAGPEQPQRAKCAAQVVGDRGGGREVGVVAADHRQEAGLALAAGGSPRPRPAAHRRRCRRGRS